VVFFQLAYNSSGGKDVSHTFVNGFWLV